MDTDAVVIQGLTKRYRDFTLDNISFRIPRGSIMGFVGENGAGKTTTIKAMLDLINTDGGEACLLGCPSKSLTMKVKSELGVVFDGSSFHDNLTIENISLIMKNIYNNWDETMFQGYISRFQLPKSKIVKEFSRGMKMKLSIAVALSHHPKLLILDEATSGLDPMVRDEILDIFLEFIQDEEHTILLSSHIISDIEKIADYVTFIHQGKIIFSKSKDELIYQYGIIHCRKEEAAAIDRSYVVGVKENNFGTDVMIQRKDEFLRRYHQYAIDKTTIEEIMLYISKGKTIQELTYANKQIRAQGRERG
jgi:ABC-2 type transport system ATP-binding protein